MTNTTISFSTNYFTSKGTGTEGKFTQLYRGIIPGLISVRACWKHFCDKYKHKKYKKTPRGRYKFPKCKDYWKVHCPDRVKKYKRDMKKDKEKAEKKKEKERAKEEKKSKKSEKKSNGYYKYRRSIDNIPN